MTVFSTWAPAVQRVRLHLDGRPLPMTNRGDGWWRSQDVPGGDLDYGFLLDDDPDPVADPRSLRQPHGVHGLSRTFDLGAHAWSDAGWAGLGLPGAVLYELHIGTFTPEGTLDSAIERLDHLVDLGITHVELLPVNAFNGSHNWGYDGVLWYTVQETYGGPAAYQRFVDACHGRGLGVIQDVVYNHLGPSGNVLPRFGPYLMDDSANTWGDTINLAEREVREYIIGNALLWLRDFHVDGLRLDAVHALLDPTERHLLDELADRVDALAAELGRPLLLIAESDLNDPTLITPQDLGGMGLTAQWSDDYHHAAHGNLTGETVGYYADFGSLAALAKTMERGFFHDGTWSSFRGRGHGIPIDPAVIEPWRLVTYTQDHDQVGNRAAGDRLTATLDEGGLALAAALTVLTPSTPMLFMGEEWGARTPWPFFTSHPEPDLAAATRAGRLAEFEQMGWNSDEVADPQDPRTFESAKLDWPERERAPHGRILELYRSLIELRRTEQGFTDPDFRTVSTAFDEDAHWFRLDRPGVTLVLNFADDERRVPTPDWGDVLVSSANARTEGGFAIVPARSFVVARRR